MAHQSLKGQVLLAHRARDGIPSLLDRFVASLFREPLLDLVAGTRALDEGKPVLTGPGVGILRGEHLDHIAAVQIALERHQPAVDLRAHRAMTDFGVHGVGEVDRCGARR